MRNIENEIMAIIPLSKLKKLVQCSEIQGFDEAELEEYIKDLEKDEEDENNEKND